MTQIEKQKLKALFVATAAYFGHEIPDSALVMYVEDLQDLPFEAVAAAMGEVRRDPKTTRCPLPAMIRARAMPQTDPEAEALEAVGRMVEAISRIGPYRVSDARNFIGELGWAVVTREGGWEQVCSVLTEENIGTLKAQWRQMALAQYRRARAGFSDAPALPEPAGAARLGLLDVKKLLPEMPR